MKRLFLSGAMLIALAATTQAAPITRAEARQVARLLVGINDHTADDDAAVAPYYIFSRGEGRGFVIVSGDDRTAPILGYTEEGDFELEQLPPQLQLMLKEWGERMRAIQQQPQGPAQRRSAMQRAVASYKKEWTDVAALVQTHWHQSSPYNDLAPVKEGMGRCMSGCVATAGSQVTYYFHRDNPKELQYDTPTYGYGTPITVSLPQGTPIEWDQIKLSGSGNTRQNNAVATLMYALGTSAWLTYGDGDGLATSGHNNKMADAMKGQFLLNSKYASKSSYSQENWEKLIYSNLKSRRPMLYSGAHPTDGGHSVVLDGYQKSTGLYHFNFGWGGQGDGWYTVDDATGMNGFNSYQDLVYDITPQQQNLAGEIDEPTMYHKAPSTISVKVKNQGTLDYSGVYIYTNTQPRIPSQTAGADIKTTIAPDGSQTFTFTVTPALQKTLYVFLCGKNKQLLDSCHVDVLPTVADLQLHSLSVDAGGETVSVDDYRFGYVNNTTATVAARLTNGEKGTYCQPAFQCFVDRYDTAAKAWERVKSVIVNDMTFEPQQTRDAIFSVTGLVPGEYYRAYMNNVAVASAQTDITFLTPDSVCYFSVRQPDLVVSIEGRNATVTGRWNETLFLQQAADTTLCAFDITALTDCATAPVAANPNALFYTADAQSELRHYDNVVAGDECEHLVVRTGADFKPSKPFTAREATFVLADAEAGKWHGALIPFAAEVPFGMQMKLPETLSSTLLKHVAVREVEAMTPVTYLTSRDDLREVKSYDVSVKTDTVVTLFDGTLLASTVAMDIEPTWLVLGDYIGSLYFVQNEGQLFTPAFHQVVVSSNGTRLRTTGETVADTYYRTMSKDINEAYNVLAQHPEAAPADVDALQAVISETEELFTYRSASENSEVKAANERLEKAIKAFVEATADGISAPTLTHVGTADNRVEYYNLSGQRINRPTGGLVIVRQGGKARKVLISAPADR